MGEDKDRDVLAAKPGLVLVVDDEADTRAIISFALQKNKHRVLEASDGEEALSVCRSELPDLVISDIMMPRMDGVQFLKSFREEYAEHFVPFLMLTAKGDVEDLISGLEKGADDYLTKPFNYKELLARAEALLRVKRLTETLYRQREALQQVNVELKNTNLELSRTQQELVRKERQLLAMQLAGAASHNLGQPLTTLLLNCRVLESILGQEGLSQSELAERTTSALSSIRMQCEALREVLEKLRKVDAEKTEEYIGDISILSLGSVEK